VSTEHQDGRESDNHQRDVIEFPRAVGAAIEDNRDNKDERTTRDGDARFGQAHPRITGLAGAALRRDASPDDQVDGADRRLQPAPAQ
jgi:hypothetical protein